MNSSLKRILPALFCVISLVSFYLFRTVPQSKLWKGWTLLFVMSDSLSEQDALAVLGESGCTGVISKSVQREPVVSPLSPLQFTSADSYIQRRMAFFSDASKKALVFYVPDGQQSAVTQAITVLERRGAHCGTDSAVSFPYVAPLFALAFALGCIAFTARKHRLQMGVSAFFFACFAFARPFFTVAAAVSLALTGICLFLRLFGRAGFARRIKSSPTAVLLLVVPVFVLCASSPLNAVLYVLACVGSAGALLLIDELTSLYYARFPHAFAPVYILSARSISLLSARSVYALTALTVTCVLLLGYSLFGANVQTAGSSTARPALPAPVARADGLLPDLDDFIAWSWKTASFPYRRIGGASAQRAASEIYPEEGERVTVPSFTESPAGVTVSEETKLVFNSEFRENVFDAVKQAPYPAVEQMMLRQGKGARYAFVRGGERITERLGTVLLVVCAAISAGLTVYFILGRRRYGFGK